MVSLVVVFFVIHVFKNLDEGRLNRLLILSGLMTKVSIIITSNCISYAGKYMKE